MINWSSKDELLKYLYSISDPKFRDFSLKITPSANDMLGVRIPTLKSIVKSADLKQREILLNIDSDECFELKILKGLAISKTKDIEEYKNNFEKFLPYIDNWAICDIFLASSKIIKKDFGYFWKRAEKLLETKDEFSNRIAFVLILDYFINEEYLNKIFDLIDSYRSDKYYANMALAWLVSTTFIKYPEETKTYLDRTQLDKEVLKMIVRKVRDSYRVSIKNKDWIKKMVN